ncbi:hypothetical protein ABZX40_23495 [Streptomyces sp. NPDC004610]|uniref:hypothetical protein n=1 Tax=unclassified Streptomyces TaxID=2593676 RepID=UPI0033BF494A
MNVRTSKTPPVEPAGAAGSAEPSGRDRPSSGSRIVGRLSGGAARVFLIVVGLF